MRPCGRATRLIALNASLVNFLRRLHGDAQDNGFLIVTIPPSCHSPLGDGIGGVGDRVIVTP